MKKIGFALVTLFALALKASPPVALGQTSDQSSTTTLYSVNKHRGEKRYFCLNFERGPSSSQVASCDLRYGSLYAGDELDWFQSASGQGDRSVIKDLGEYSWTAEFEVPFVDPLPKLKPGEQRVVTVDTSGADGADGAAGAPGAPAQNGDGSITPSAPGTERSPTETKPSTPVRPKRDGKPKVDPLFVKAIRDHMYVIHVVDDTHDFYALFHVDDLVRGDSCTVSWKFIPAPSSAAK
jgi:hypothetical protein